MIELQEFLGSYEPVVQKAITKLHDERVISRIWNGDHTLWKPEPEEIANRLGWLQCPETIQNSFAEIESFAAEARDSGFTNALLIGMGGSSLAPEVFRLAFGARRDSLDLKIFDSIDPDDIVSVTKDLDFNKTLFVISSKSGTTLETISLFHYFFAQCSKVVGAKEAGRNFIAITDQGGPLGELAQQHDFRKIFFSDPNTGGRYSALSHVGLVPAALIGVDLSKLLDSASAMAKQCQLPDERNPAARLGAVLAELALAGRDKLTLTTSPEILPFGSWLEQLVAESTGKDGKGILPVIGDQLLSAASYGSDRLFVDLSLSDDQLRRTQLKMLEKVGHPWIQLSVRDKYDLGAQFFLWEMATAIACWRLGVNPFDQPNVEDSKIRAREKMQRFRESGKLSDDYPIINVSNEPSHLRQQLSQFFSLERKRHNPKMPRSYVALQSYLPHTSEINTTLQDLRTKIESAHQLAVTIGYGPRFLHSTGQLHKGDGGHGLFIQLISDSDHIVEIPNESRSADSSMTFSLLKHAVALGDRQALQSAGRKVITFQLGRDIVSDLKQLIAATG